MLYQPTAVINGMNNKVRLSTRELEEEIQRALEEGHRCIEVHAYGQHGIGGRLWRGGEDQVFVRILGSPGQRVGAMGFRHTRVEVMGPASDDVGWLNAGAEIIVHGHATNGVGNGMAQGKIYVEGSIGARGMTMTKHNPHFEPPELWVLGRVGDSFAEFMSGGVAVICGYGVPPGDNVLGYKPGVGMVGGKIFFRGGYEKYSDTDAYLADLSLDDWEWLTSQLAIFLREIGRSDVYRELTADSHEWRVIIARKPWEKAKGRRCRPMAQFRTEVWEKELGTGGLFGDLIPIVHGTVDVVPTGIWRRFIPRWENNRYLPPCQSACPTGIPVRERWRLIRQGRWEEAVNLALEHTPLPATVCGYLCPQLCMDHCTRTVERLTPLDMAAMGRATLTAKAPTPAPPSGKRIAIIGGGPAGLSVAWQLWLLGHEPIVYEQDDHLGGKVTAVIPESRIPDEVVSHELNRFCEQIRTIKLKQPITRRLLQRWKGEYDFIIIASGAGRPKKLPISGSDRALSALDFLRRSRADDLMMGERVVIIGAGNVGCDVASEALRLGAREVTLVDIQEPASFGSERKHLEEQGARFLWPRITKAITDRGVELERNETIPADLVVMAVGDVPDLSFVPETVARNGGFIAVNAHFQTSDPQIFAIGDVVRLGLLTDAIGAGKVAAQLIDDTLRGRVEQGETSATIDRRRVKLAYYDPRQDPQDDVGSCAEACASCGACRDCGLCETLCPQRAITRRETGGGGYEYVVNDEHCIGCGFCADACPCGIWVMEGSTPIQ